MRTKSTKAPTSFALILALAGKATCDPRTAAKALEHGPETIRARAVRERVIDAMHALDLKPSAA